MRHNNTSDYPTLEEETNQLAALRAKALTALNDIRGRLHELDVALGVDPHLAAEVFRHLESRVEAAIREMAE